jgi:hypothetical protein
MCRDARRGPPPRRELADLTGVVAKGAINEIVVDGRGQAFVHGWISDGPTVLAHLEVRAR